MAVILNEKPLPSLCVQAAPISVQLDLPSRSLQTLKTLWVGRLEGVVVIGVSPCLRVATARLAALLSPRPHSVHGGVNVKITEAPEICA